MREFSSHPLRRRGSYTVAMKSFTALCAGQVLPSAHQQPLLPFDQCALLFPMAEELRPPHLVDGLIDVLQDVELVIDDLALRRPLLDAQPERLPHVHARRLNPPPLPTPQLATKELIQRLLLPFLAEPQGFPRL